MPISALSCFQGSSLIILSPLSITFLSCESVNHLFLFLPSVKESLRREKEAKVSFPEADLWSRVDLLISAFSVRCGDKQSSFSKICFLYKLTFLCSLNLIYFLIIFYVFHMLQKNKDTLHFSSHKKSLDVGVETYKI